MTDQQHEFIRNTLTQMINLLGLDVDIESEEDGETIILKLKTPEPGRLIGRKGRTLESIEYLLGRIISQKYEMQPRMKLDVDGYQSEKPAGRAPGKSSRPNSAENKPRGGRPDGRAPASQRSKHDETLVKKALDIVKEVKRWGDPKTLGPLSVAERKVVHETLAGDPSVKAESGPDLGGGKKTITVRAAEQQAPQDDSASHAE